MPKMRACSKDERVEKFLEVARQIDQMEVDLMARLWPSNFEKAKAEFLEHGAKFGGRGDVCVEETLRRPNFEYAKLGEKEIGERLAQLIPLDAQVNGFGTGSVEYAILRMLIQDVRQKWRILEATRMMYRAGASPDFRAKAESCFQMFQRERYGEPAELWMRRLLAQQWRDLPKLRLGEAEFDVQERLRALLKGVAILKQAPQRVYRPEPGVVLKFRRMLRAELKRIHRGGEGLSATETLEKQEGKHLLRILRAEGSWTSRLESLNQGLPGSWAFTEGLARCLEQTLSAEDGEICLTGVDQYINVGLAYFEGWDFRKIFELRWRMIYLAGLRPEESDETREARYLAAREEAFAQAMECFRGALNTPNLHGTMSYAGQMKVWQYIAEKLCPEEKLWLDAEARKVAEEELLEGLFRSGRIDPTNKLHQQTLHYAEEAGLFGSERRPF